MSGIWPGEIPGPGQVYVCARCGSPNCETESWVTVNGNEITDAVDPGDIWCPECETHDTELIIGTDSGQPGDRCTIVCCLPNGHSGPCKVTR